MVNKFLCVFASQCIVEERSRRRAFSLLRERASSTCSVIN